MRERCAGIGNICEAVLALRAAHDASPFPNLQLQHRVDLWNPKGLPLRKTSRSPSFETPSAITVNFRGSQSKPLRSFRAARIMKGRQPERAHEFLASGVQFKVRRFGGSDMSRCIRPAGSFFCRWEHQPVTAHDCGASVTADFSSIGNSSIFAARMKSFSESPPIA